MRSTHRTISKKNKGGAKHRPLFFDYCLGFVHIYLGFLKKSFIGHGVSLFLLCDLSKHNNGTTSSLLWSKRSPRWIQQTVQRLECTIVFVSNRYQTTVVKLCTTSKDRVHISLALCVLFHSKGGWSVVVVRVVVRVSRRPENAKKKETRRRRR